jgi:enterochelin esterase-like enzyme
MATDNSTDRPRRLQPLRGLRQLSYTSISVVVLLGTSTAAVLARVRGHAQARPAAAAAHAASSGGAGLAPAPPSPAKTVSLSCQSPSLGGTLPTLVYLPRGYLNSTGRYPVVYFLHGLPANPTSYEYNGFIAQSLATAGKPAIVVTPQGARSQNADREYLDWSTTENWPRAISHDLVGCIDHRYRTIAGRDGRALTGLSAGGYGAFNIGLRTLSVFGAVESWSGYFAATDPAGTTVLNLGSQRADADAAVPTVPELNAELAEYPSYIAFYVGAQDTRFYQDNQSFDATLTTGRIQHVYATYPGGHSMTLWRGEAPTWLGNALDYLAGLRAHRPAGATGATGSSGATGAT